MGFALPIKDISTINKIKELYEKKEQFSYLLLFELAINTGICLNELLKLNVKDVKGKYHLVLKNNKSIPLNSEIIDLINAVIKGRKQNEPLFKTLRGSRMDRICVFYSFREICKELGISNKYNVSSWRKTFAYHHYQKYKDLSYLLWLFSQSKVVEALRFIDVEENLNLRFREGVRL